MRWSLFLKLACLIFLITLPVSAEGPGRRVTARPTLRITTGNTGPGIIFHDPRGPRRKVRDCFPYSCKGIGVEQTNPNPRTDLQKPACYYGTDNVLFFEKEGSNCSYIEPLSANELRVEKRRQEWLLKRKRTNSLRRLRLGDGEISPGMTINSPWYRGVLSRL